MIVNATDFKNKVGKYLELVNKETIVISRNGKLIAKLVPVEKSETPNVEGLLDLLTHGKKETIDQEKLREERLKKYESLT